MVIYLCVFLAVFFFELRSLFKSGEKKEAVLYIILAVFAVSVGALIMLVPDYISFSRIILKLFNLGQ